MKSNITTKKTAKPANAKKSLSNAKPAAKKQVKTPKKAKPAVKKAPLPKAKPAAKKTVKKTPVKKEIKPSKPVLKPRIEKTVSKPELPDKHTEKPVNHQSNLGLPEGSVYQQTGQRRPLIVFPK